MATVRYTVVDGEVIAEKRGGVRRTYVPDPLGSMVALLDNSQTKTDTFSYWPYGEIKTRTGTTATPFQFVGSFGYYRDTARIIYIRSRSYDPATSAWVTSDANPRYNSVLAPHKYANANPSTLIDPDGNRAISRSRPADCCKKAESGHGLCCNCSNSPVTIRRESPRYAEEVCVLDPGECARCDAFEAAPFHNCGLVSGWAYYKIVDGCRACFREGSHGLLVHDVQCIDRVRELKQSLGGGCVAPWWPPRRPGPVPPPKCYPKECPIPSPSTRANPQGKSTSQKPRQARNPG